jgi:hypothetical protein
MFFPLARLGSDHIPIHIQNGTTIPEVLLFRLKNYCYDLDGFIGTATKAWSDAPIKNDMAPSLNAKFKCLRAALKKWSRNLSNLNIIIGNCNFTLAMLDGLEEQRELSMMKKKTPELSSRTILPRY